MATPWTRRRWVTVAGGGLTLLALGGLPVGCGGDKFESCDGDCRDAGAGGSAGADGDGASTGGAGGAGGADGTSTASGGSGGSGASGGSGGSAGSASAGSGGSLGSGGSDAGGSSSTGTDGGEAGDNGTGEGGAGATGSMGSCQDTCEGTCCGEQCVDLDSSIDHCGVCGVVCSLYEAEEACVAGSCVVTQCEENAVDCNGVASDGCEGVDSGSPEAPMPVRPAFGAFTGSLHAREKTGSLRPEFSWTKVEPVSCDALRYQVQIDDTCDFSEFADCDFPSPEVDVTEIKGERFAPEADLPVEEEQVPLGRRYYWRVRACESNVLCSAWSDVFYVDVGRARDDVTGDGYPDIVGTAAHNQLFIVRGRADFYENAQGEVLPTIEARVHPYSQLNYLGDVDGDGFNDVGGVAMSLSMTKELLYVWRGAADTLVIPGEVVANRNRTGGPGGVWPAGDHDRDGYADLVLLTRYNDIPDTFTIKHGSPVLVDSPADELVIAGLPASPEQPVRSVTSGDFNGDGYVDLAIDAGIDQEDVAFILGEPESSFLPLPSIYDGSTPGDSCGPILDTVDFNGDGIDDVVRYCKTAERINVIFGEPDFVPSKPDTVGLILETEIEDLAVGDLDNSGIEDLLLSDGTTFWGAPEPSVEADDSLATEVTSEPILVGDHDADGDLDVLRDHRWYRGLVTQATSYIYLTTDEGDELSVVKLAR